MMCKVNEHQLGQRIREERKRLGMTQTQLSEEIDVSSTYIGFVERGERSVTLEKLVDISNALGVTVDYLLSDSVESPNPSNKQKLMLSLFASASDSQQDLIIEITKLILKH